MHPVPPSPNTRSPTPSPGGAQLNANRMLVTILRQICGERRIELNAFSDDWILVLRRGDRTTRVVGYDFDLNSATAKMLCKDKSATSDLLQFAGIPHVEHHLFHGPRMQGYVPSTSNWTRMLAFFAASGRDVVCKPNEGTGGVGVLRARSEAELEAAVMTTFATERSLCLSRFEAITGEYRAVILQGEVRFLYRKDRPAVVGDGRRSLRELVLAQAGAAQSVAGAITATAQLAEELGDTHRIPAAGEKVVVNWRHNLAGGAAPHLLDLASAEAAPILPLACQAMDAVGAKLASVDVVQTNDGLKVLEINSGIMTEHLARSSAAGFRLAYQLYDRIVCLALDIADPAS